MSKAVMFFRSFTFLCLSLLVSNNVLSQYSFVFLDSISKEPIEQVYVQFYKSGLFEQVYDAQISDLEGKVEFNQDKDSIYFITSHLQYKQLLVSESVTNCSPCIFYLEHGTFRLSEIQISANDLGVRVIGDTIRFDLNIFSNKSQKDLKDLIETLPGMEIKANGEILYNNKPIDKILLSGQDVFKSQFDMLNQMIGKDIVETVQIIPGEKTNMDEEPSQYLDIVLNKEYKTLAQLGLGISHTKRAEQEGSILFTGDRPVQSFINLKNRALDKPSISSGDEMRKIDFEIIQARANLHNKLAFSENLSDIYHDGTDRHDFFIQTNTQINRNKFQASNYIDFRRRTHDLENSSQKRNPINNQPIEFSSTKLNYLEESFSTYYKQIVRFGEKQSITSFISFDTQKEAIHKNGSSLFSEKMTDFSSNEKRNYNDFIFYNTYVYTIFTDLEFEFESDQNYKTVNKELLISSSDTLFSLNTIANDKFILDHLQNRSINSTVFRPKIRYTINPQQNISIYSQYLRTWLKDRSILKQDLLDKTFNANFSQTINRYDSGLLYKLKKDKYEFWLNPSYTAIKISDLQNGTFNFLLRYRYNFSTYLSLISTLTRSYNVFSTDQLFHSAVINSNRDFTLYDDMNMPTYSQWNFSSVLRYINTASGKIFFVGFNKSTSSQSLVPKILILKNAQKTIFVKAGSTSQIRVSGFLRFTLLKNYVTTRFNINKTNSFIADENILENLITYHCVFNSTFQTKITKYSELNLSLGLDAISQHNGLISHSFETITPDIVWKQYVFTNIWLELNYQPLIRLGLLDQHLVDCTISTKYFKDKLNLSLTFRDVLNFNNAIFINKAISSNVINETITNRIGGYIYLSANYQFR